MNGHWYLTVENAEGDRYEFAVPADAPCDPRQVVLDAMPGFWVAETTWRADFSQRQIGGLGGPPEPHPGSYGNPIAPASRAPWAEPVKMT